jgi:hypothetical protein
MENYKDDIRATRKGCLGSSDAKILEQIAALGYVPKSAYKRLAIVKGLIPQTDIPETDAIRTGNEIENKVFEYLKWKDPRYQSNVRWESSVHSTKNVKLIAHPDIVLKDDARKTLFVYEVKTTKYNVNDTRATYKAQLFIENLLAREIASTFGKEWSVKTFLVHYSTDGLDLTEGIEFDPTRITIKEVHFTTSNYFDIRKAMAIVNTFLENFTEFYEQEEVDANLLPANVQTQFSEVAQFLREIKEREAKVDAFKAKLYDFLSERGIKKVSCDDFSFAVVAPTQQISVDYKALFTQEIEAKKPRVAKRLKDKYKKTTNKKGYVVIKTGNNNE